MKPNEVHVWRAPLAQPADIVARLSATLSPDEHEQAARFRSQIHRARFVLGRGIQRDVLARYVHVPAADLVFAYSSRGKPSLAGTAAASALTFSVSNSGNLTVCAVACGRAVGLDIEEARAVSGASTIAERLFTAQERAALDALPSAERSPAFLRLWVRREARIKALGGSVWEPPGAVAADGPDGEARHAAPYAHDSRMATGWVTQALDLGPDCIGELVVEGDVSPRIRHFDWSPTGLIADRA
jgi:4'-phosphopantetheinyl transferase